MDVPVALAIVVAFVTSTGAAFAPAGVFGHDVFFDSTAMFIAFLLGGRALELRARHRAEASLEEVATRLPRSALRVGSDGASMRVDVADIAVGDRLHVPYGEAFVVDGVVVEGWTQADESLLTGESRPVPKHEGDAAVAGSLNLGGPVAVRVDRVGADTRAEAIAAPMRAARSQRPAMTATADRWAGPFLWAVLVLAAAAGAAWSVIDPARVVWVVVSVLVLTCPCALSRAVPAALLAATSALARQSLLLRNLDAISGLARVRTLFIDKTGTLTDGKVHCTGRHDLRGDGGATDRALAGTASSLAAWSTHPLSRALNDAWPVDGPVWSELAERPGWASKAIDRAGAALAARVAGLGRRRAPAPLVRRAGAASRSTAAPWRPSTSTKRLRDDTRQAIARAARRRRGDPPAARATTPTARVAWASNWPGLGAAADCAGGQARRGAPRSSAASSSR